MKTKYISYVLPFVLAAAILWSWSALETGLREAESAGDKSADSAENGLWETRKDEGFPVNVSVTPVEFGRDAGKWKFSVTMDTHSVELNEDILKSVSLRDDGGNIYLPLAWEGSPPGGHHREGILTFNPVSPAPAYAELKIEYVGGAEERLFRWELK